MPYFDYPGLARRTLGGHFSESQGFLKAADADVLAAINNAALVRTALPDSAADQLG